MGVEDIVCEGFNEFKWDTGYLIVRSRPWFANPDSLTRHVLSTSEMYTHWQSDDRSRYGLYIDNLLLKEIAINRFEINIIIGVCYATYFEFLSQVASSLSRFGGVDVRQHSRREVLVATANRKL